MPYKNCREADEYAARTSARVDRSRVPKIDVLDESTLAELNPSLRDVEQTLSHTDAWQLAYDDALEICAMLPGDLVLRKISKSEAHITVREIPDLSWHAQTTKVPGHKDCYLICASSAQRDALYTLVKASLFLSQDSAEGRDIVLRFLRALTARLRLDQGWVRGVNLKLSRQERSIALELTSIAETFIVLHELAHIQLGHLDKSAASKKEQRLREHECDFAAFAGLLSAPKSEWTTTHVILGVDLAIATQALLEESQWWLRDESHASGRERRQMLKVFFSRITQAAYSYESYTATLPLGPFATVAKVTGVHYVEPFPKPLGEELTVHRDLFAFPDDEHAIAWLKDWYSQGEDLERRLRGPTPQQYSLLARALVAPEIVARVDRWMKHSGLPWLSESDFHRRSAVADLHKHGKVSYAEYRQQEAESLAGQVVFYEFALAKFNTVVDRIKNGPKRAVGYAALVTSLEKDINEDAVFPLVALTIQLKGGRTFAWPITNTHVTQLCAILGINPRSTQSRTLEEYSLYQTIYMKDVIKKFSV